MRRTVSGCRKRRKVHEPHWTSRNLSAHPRINRPSSREGVRMAATVSHSLVQQFASMKPAEFGSTIEPKWQVCERLVKEGRTAVEKQYLTPLDGARGISSVTATLFGHDGFILRE